MGRPAAAVIAALGGGYVERTRTDGRRELSWVWIGRPTGLEQTAPEGVVRSRGGLVAVPERNTAAPSGHRCELAFILGPDGRVVDWQRFGQDCDPLPPGTVR